MKNFDQDSNIDPDENEDEADLEGMQELEKRKEEIIEEFLELAFTKKHEELEEAKALIKKEKVSRDIEKKRLEELGH